MRRHREPTATTATIDFDVVLHDRDADVLCLSVGDPARAVRHDTTAEGHALLYDEVGGLVGVTIAGVRDLVDNGTGVQLLVRITLRADVLAQAVAG